MSPHRAGRHCEFSLSHYAYIIESAQRLGYSLYPFSEWIRSKGVLTGSRTVLLRHDIDVSVDRAVDMARFEMGLGISGTYFLRLHSRYYDVDQPGVGDLVRELGDIADLGLHYERGYYSQLEADHLDMLKSDREAMLRFVQGKDFGCAAHRPGIEGPFEEEAVRSTGLAYEAYAPHFTRERKYLSDSAAHWREGCVCGWLGRADHLTVLIHPIWWMDWPEPPDEVVRRLREGD